MRPKSEAYPTPLRTYGDCLKARRLDLGLLQKQMAEELGVDETTIYNWENNRTEPELRFMPRIIELLGYCIYVPGLSAFEWLKLVRQSLGYSQARIAEALGLDESTWQRWEVGRKQPKSEYLSRIRSLLEIV